MDHLSSTLGMNILTHLWAFKLDNNSSYNHPLVLTHSIQQKITVILCQKFNPIPQRFLNHFHNESRTYQTCKSIRNSFQINSFVWLVGATTTSSGITLLAAAPNLLFGVHHAPLNLELRIKEALQRLCRDHVPGRAPLLPRHSTDTYPIWVSLPPHSSHISFQDGTRVVRWGFPWDYLPSPNWCTIRSGGRLRRVAAVNTVAKSQTSFNDRKSVWRATAKKKKMAREFLCWCHYMEGADEWTVVVSATEFYNYMIIIMKRFEMEPSTPPSSIGRNNIFLCYKRWTEATKARYVERRDKPIRVIGLIFKLFIRHFNRGVWP